MFCRPRKQLAAAGFERLSRLSLGAIFCAATTSVSRISNEVPLWQVRLCEKLVTSTKRISWILKNSWIGNSRVRRWNSDRTCRWLMWPRMNWWCTTCSLNTLWFAICHVKLMTMMSCLFLSESFHNSRRRRMLLRSLFFLPLLHRIDSSNLSPTPVLAPQF